MRGNHWQVVKWFASITDSGKDEFPESGKAFLGMYPNAQRYEIRDDDGIVYAHIVALTDEGAEEALDFMMDNYGATSLWEEMADGTWNLIIG